VHHHDLYQRYQIFRSTLQPVLELIHGAWSMALHLCKIIFVYSLANAFAHRNIDLDIITFASLISIKNFRYFLLQICYMLKVELIVQNLKTKDYRTHHLWVRIQDQQFAQTLVRS
jgi:hypothetical protein